MFKLLSRLSPRVRAAPETIAATDPTTRERLSDAEWEWVRAPQRNRDRTLSDKATRWRQALPAELQPDALCSHFPRIANRLAHCWRDHGLTDYLFDDLLIDHRGSREGFPAVVTEELRRLQAFHEARSPYAVPGSGAGPDTSTGTEQSVHANP